MTMPQRQLEVELPIGVTDEHNQVHRWAKIRKMRGHEEALMYDDSLSSAQLITKLIHSCLIQLGDLKRINESTAAHMYTADRNFLLLEIRRFTLGNHLQSSYFCPGCGLSVSIKEDLSQLPVRRLDQGQMLSDIEVHLEDGYEDRQGALHMDIVLTLPRGVDEEFVASTAAKDPLKAQDALLLRCIKQFGELPKATLEAYGVKILRDLTLGDRQRLQQGIAAKSPGVDFQRTIQCNSCGITFEDILDTSFFFLLQLNGAQRLRQEIFYLAYHLHWARSEIMAMEINERHQFVRMLAQRIEDENKALETFTQRLKTS